MDGETAEWMIGAVTAYAVQKNKKAKQAQAKQKRRR